MKRIKAAIASLMVLCLALTCCGQGGGKTNEPDSQTSQTGTVATTDSQSKNSTGAKTSPAGSNGASDPAEDSDMYTYDLHGGVTLSCSTNVRDYIKGNTFDLRAMAHSFGFADDLNKMPESHGFVKDFNGQSVIIAFSGDERTDLSDPHYMFVGITRYGTDGGVREIAVEYHFDEAAQYKINGSGPALSFDAIPIIAYAFENFSLDNKDPFADIFDPYRLPKEEKRVSWRDYRLP